MSETEQLSKEEQKLLDIERDEWLESLDYVIKNGGPERVKRLLRILQNRAARFGIHLPYSANTPYVNTIAPHEQPRFPGKHDIEWRIRCILRWNAMAMVVRANKEASGIGGHISTYGSAATLYEVGFNHFFRGKDDPSGGDMIYIQGHTAPGIYARAFLEGRITEEHMLNFRRDNREKHTTSYPHPYLMQDFWEFPTVSMGLGPIMAIYQARFAQYLRDRGLTEKSGKVWAFLGDGETDEPESLGAISLASREKLDNLIFVINCNLQRLDGPVRGNGKIIQELEAVFRGAGWNVIKVIWGAHWDPLLSKDEDGLLVQRMDEAVDGEYQKYSASGADYIRKHFFGKYEKLAAMVDNWTDDDIRKLNRGGHDPEKVYAAYRRAVETTGQPTVILAKTIKGYGLGEAGEGRNITHQQKKLNEEELKAYRARMNIPISEEDATHAPFYHPGPDSPEIKYLQEKRKQLGGYLPERRPRAPDINAPNPEIYQEFYTAGEGREASTTMIVVRILGKLLKDPAVGKFIVPIIPDEARTFGMEGLFRQAGIYAHAGQLYEPVDRETLLYYKEAKDGQILEEGITEAGAMSSFIAAGSAYTTYGVNTIPFFLFYSMFGFQRVGDLIWAAGDMGVRGFLFGGTAGRTTLAGEGLQHQDGNSLLYAVAYPHVRCYDPAFAYEIAVLIEEGIREMFIEKTNEIFYITIENENYEMPDPPAPIKELREPILKGMYLFQKADESSKKTERHVQLLGSGPLMNDTLKAAALLKEEYGITADVWSVTSYKQLFVDATDHERSDFLNQSKGEPYFIQCLGSKDQSAAVVAVSDYVKMLPYSLAKWLDRPMIGLGTDGFGRSEDRAGLREHFEVDHRYITIAAIRSLVEAGNATQDELSQAIEKLNIDTEKDNPMMVVWGRTTR